MEGWLGDQDVDTDRVLMTGKLDGTSVWSWKGTTLKNKAE